jgi:hypothetical protein
MPRLGRPSRKDGFTAFLKQFLDDRLHEAISVSSSAVQQNGSRWPFGYMPLGIPMVRAGEGFTQERLRRR